MAKRLSAKVKAERAQQRQINRINKIISTFERQGFTVSQRLKNQMRVTGTTAGKAKQKAERLKNIKTADVRKQLTAYTTDKGQTKKGKKGVKQGLKTEKRKRKIAKQNRISAIDNISSLASSATDYVYYDKDGNNTGVNIDVSGIKQKVVSSWSRYISTHKQSQMDVRMLNRIWGWMGDLQRPSQQENEYDDTAQKIINELDGEPMAADEIENAEGIDLIDILM